MAGSVLFLLLGFFLILLFLLGPRRPKNFPPGPAAIFLFGNVLQLSMSNPVEDLNRLAKRYGNVFSLYIGKKPAVVLHGLRAVKEALVVHAADFAGRPQGLMLNHVTENKGLIMANYGPVWKEHRRFALTTMKNFGLGKQSMEERILEETLNICQHLESSSGKLLDPQPLIHSAASNIVSSMLFGTRYGYDDEVLAFIINSFKENARKANSVWAMIYDSFPLLRHLPLPFRKVFENYEALKNHTRSIIADHKKTRIPEEPRDVIDCYLDEMEKENEGTSLDEDRLVMFLLDLHFAGTDTTSNTILTALLYLSVYRDVQVLCQQEIDTVLQAKEHVSYEDRQQMPFVQATIHELQRLANIAPLGVFHSTTRNTQLMGYDIPEGTLVITNLTSVLYEHSQWAQPNDFYPSHFLNEQGEFVKPEAFLAFSAGPRVCLGEALARMELFLILVTLLWRFHFVWPEDCGGPDLRPVFGGIQAPKPYRLTVIPRRNQGDHVAF
ncbi:cytochrome P450 2D15-like [Salminus brasiliensis]|uniref:cytochrome P450 2D15-like n=1 Tax=Salminus brasiliensis TaxID=930266 RepID=UPI003B82F006